MFTSLISRSTVRISEVTKFRMMYKWSTFKVATQLKLEGRLEGENVCGEEEERELIRTIMNRVTRDLKLHKIPPPELIKVRSSLSFFITYLITENVLQYVLPTKMIHHDRMLQTLLYQVDSGVYGVAKFPGVGTQ